MEELKIYPDANAILCVKWLPQSGTKEDTLGDRKLLVIRTAVELKCALMTE